MEFKIILFVLAMTAVLAVSGCTSPSPTATPPGDNRGHSDGDSGRQRLDAVSGAGRGGDCDSHAYANGAARLYERLARVCLKHKDQLGHERV